MTPSVLVPGAAVGDPALWLPYTTPLVDAWRRRRHRTAVLASGIFLAGLFLDYGGGFGFKYLAIGVAFLWVLLRHSSYDIWRQHRSDLIVLLGLPALLSVGHFIWEFLGAGGHPSAAVYGARFYNTVSSPALVLLLPLVFAVGASTLMRQMRVGFLVVALFLIALFVLHTSGAIDLSQYTDFFDHYQLGAIGLDTRITDTGIEQRGQYSLRVAFAIPLILGHELAGSGIGAVLQFIALLIVGSRGLLLGAGLLLVVWWMMAMTPARRRALFLRATGSVALLVTLVLLVPELRFRVSEVLVQRTLSMLAGEDYTTLIRLGHLAGYRNLVVASPITVLVGAGPTGAIENPFYALVGYDPRVSVTEFSLLNVALYYGVPYALLYVGWLYRGAWRLWKLRRLPTFRRADLGLIVGAVVFWMTGNTNPQMTAPFAILAYLALTVRAAEVTAGRG